MFSNKEKHNIFYLHLEFQFSLIQKAFSIIELLIVISILMILGSLLMPTLNRTLEQGKIHQCFNILKHNYIADDIYAEDNNEYYVIIKSTPWRYTWFRNTTYLSLLNTSVGDIRDEPELSCPNYSAPSYNRFSYAPNWANDKFWWNTFRNQSVLRNRVFGAAKKIKMIENTDWHSTSFQGNPNRWNSSGEVGSNNVAYRHRDSTNMTFFDGHTENRTADDVYYSGNWDQIHRLWRISGDAFSKGLYE